MATTDYDENVERYQHEMDRAVSFAGRSHDFFTQAKADELVRLACRAFGDTHELRALDVGSGVGLTHRFLRGVFASLTGVDVAVRAVQRATETNPWARYAVYDGRRLPFEDRTFDLVFTVCVIQVLAPQSRSSFVAELARVVRPGGLVVAFEHNPLNPATRLVVHRCEFGHDARMLGLRALRTLIAGAGLAIEDWAYILLLPWRRGRIAELERRARRLPLGAQVYVAGRRI